MERFKLRQAGADDIDDIMRLEAEGFAAGIHERREVFLARIATFPTGFLLLHHHDGSAAGYFCSERWQAQDKIAPEQLTMNHDIASTHREDGDELYISSMTLAPQWRGCGLGEAFFLRCLTQLRQMEGLSSAVLLVNEQWTAARQIYQRHGFVESTRLPGFFQTAPPADALLMRRATL